MNGYSGNHLIKLITKMFLNKKLKKFHPDYIFNLKKKQLYKFI